MYNKSEFLNRIKLKIKVRKFEEANEMLEKEIKEIFIEELKRKDKNYKYTNMLNLKNKAEELLNNDFLININKYYIITHEECSQIYKLDIYMNIYKSIKG